MRDRLRRSLRRGADVLARLGRADRDLARRAVDLAAPVMVTGGMRTVLRATDLLMVSLVLGGPAVAGLELGFQYYFLGFGAALGLSSGTISVVSRMVGRGDRARANQAVLASVLLSLLVTVPLTAASWVWAEPMVGLLTGDPDTVREGGAYLRFVMLGVSVRFWGLIASRALAGAGDTRTPMLVRLLTVPTNLVLNLVLILGLGPAPRMGAAGAGLGTTLANVLAGGIFLVLLVRGTSGIRLPVRDARWDPALALEVLRVGSPLAGVHVVRTLGRFPFLYLLAVLGTPVVAAYAVGRQIMLLAMMPAWGYGTAASTLVGNAVGRDEPGEADRAGWATARVAVANQVLLSLGLVLLAAPLASVFDVGAPVLVRDFLIVFAVGVPAYSVSRTVRGALRGAGDPMWPLGATVVGTLVRLVLTALGPAAGAAALVLGGVTLDLGVGLGVGAAYAAILVDLYLRAGIVSVRFRSGAWRDVARRARGRGLTGPP